MPYEHQRVRILLGEGHWTEMFEFLKHGTEKRVKEIGRRYLRGKDGQNPSFRLTESNGVTSGTVTGEVEIDLEQFDATSATDAMILMQTTEWSFGPITQEILDDLPITMRDQIDAWMGVHYIRPKAESGGNGSGKVCSSPSREERRHPSNSKKRSSV